MHTEHARLESQAEAAVAAFEAAVAELTNLEEEEFIALDPDLRAAINAVLTRET